MYTHCRAIRCLIVGALAAVGVTAAIDGAAGPSVELVSDDIAAYRRRAGHGEGGEEGEKG